MRFSQRTAWQTGSNEWVESAESLRRQGRSLVDLTNASPPSCGLSLPEDEVLAPLRSSSVLRYAPEPFGMLVAREAVCGYYHDHGCPVQPERVCLTTSTSEAYSFLFRLLCDSGDEVLIARPSYPLFDLLAALNDVVLREYPLFYDAGASAFGHGGWLLDVEALEASVTERTRALVLVHPNNPTGHYASAEERVRLMDLCASRKIALIVDEVFLDYSMGKPLYQEEVRSGRRSFADCSACLCFTLSGLSKVCALPQMKASWIVMNGPAQQVTEASRRLEIIADTYLSMNGPVQASLGSWLSSRRKVQAMVLGRLEGNLAALDRHLKGSLGERFQMEGGWTSVLRVPRFVEDEPFAVAALRQGVLVQPGVFYGLSEGRCVLSLLPDSQIFQEGLRRLPLGQS